MTPMCVVDRVLDDGSAVAKHLGRTAIVEGTFHCTERYEVAVGPYVVVSRVSSTPLATIRAAWSEIVGADVARAAQPVALVGSALVVVTASDAWSHQLSFLERSILASVNALGVRGVERLRFRIGEVAA